MFAVVPEGHSASDPGGAREGRKVDGLRPQLCTLAFFDVLGFSDRLRRLGLEVIFELYSALADLLDGMKDPGAFSFWVPTDFDGDVLAQMAKASRGEGSQWAPAASVDSDPGVAYFSDTILLWMPYDPVRCGAFMDLTIHFFCQALNLDIPLRGAVAIGELHMDKQRQVFLGGPIIEAARAESAQCWCGFSLCPSFRDYPCIVPGDRFRDYDAQIKTGASDLVLPFAVDWTWHWRTLFPDRSIASIADAFRRGPDDPYWANTVAFANESEAVPPSGLGIRMMGRLRRT